MTPAVLKAVGFHSAAFGFNIFIVCRLELRKGEYTCCQKSASARFGENCGISSQQPAVYNGCWLDYPSGVQQLESVSSELQSIRVLKRILLMAVCLLSIIGRWNGL
jgi:hypothetical protein